MIYIVRHGQTARNAARVLQGRCDCPMNDEGEAQAAAVGAWFRGQGIRFDHVWSSPLQRALRTARAVAGREAEIRIDQRLIEMDYGPYEGMDLSDPAPELKEFFRDFTHNPAPAGMEPLSEVRARLGAFLESLRQTAPSGTILISTHAIAMKGALEYLDPAAEGRYWSTYIPNCAVYRTDFTQDGFVLPQEVPTW
ncbi:MAG: histidine phosphatase family protein [Oscillospiraceae bacterium]|nr:histidine phosphatase family protein [Oscillospiraceae bacterium]